MTTVVNEQLFAVRWEVKHSSNEWICGSLEFIISGQRIGDWEDATALSTAFGWMKDFSQHPSEQHNPELMNIDKETVVSLLHDRYMVSKITSEDLGEEDVLYSNPDHLISYLGMSSFDNWVLILVENFDGQRIVWANQTDKVVHEAFLPPRTIQTVLNVACELFYAQQT